MERHQQYFSLFVLFASPPGIHCRLLKSLYKSFNNLIDFDNLNLGICQPRPIAQNVAVAHVQLKVAVLRGGGG